MGEVGWREGFGGNKRRCELFRDTSRGLLKRRGGGLPSGGREAPLWPSPPGWRFLCLPRPWLLERQDHCSPSGLPGWLRTPREARLLTK